MGIEHDREARADALTDQDGPARWVHTAESIAGTSGVASEPANGGLVVFVGGRVVGGGAELGQVMVIHDIEQIDIPVLMKVRMQGQAQQTVVLPRPHLLADVDEGIGLFDVVLDDPDPPAAIPGIPKPEGIESDPYELVERAVDLRLDKPERVICRRQARRQKAQDDPRGRDQDKPPADPSPGRRPAGRSVHAKDSSKNKSCRAWTRAFVRRRPL